MDRERQTTQRERKTYTESAVVGCGMYRPKALFFGELFLRGLSLSGLTRLAALPLRSISATIFCLLIFPVLGLRSTSDIMLCLLGRSVHNHMSENVCLFVSLCLCLCFVFVCVNAQSALPSPTLCVEECVTQTCMLTYIHTKTPKGLFPGSACCNPPRITHPRTYIQERKK